HSQPQHSLTHTHTLTHSQPQHSLTHTHTQTHTLSLSLSHTHTHTHTHIPTQGPFRARPLHCLPPVCGGPLHAPGDPAVTLGGAGALRAEQRGPLGEEGHGGGDGAAVRQG